MDDILFPPLLYIIDRVMRSCITLSAYFNVTVPIDPAVQWADCLRCHWEAGQQKSSFDRNFDLLGLDFRSLWQAYLQNAIFVAGLDLLSIDTGRQAD